MATTELSINTRSAMSPYNQILKLKEHILGELSAESKAFLDNLCAKNEENLNKLIVKLKKNEINIKAKDFDLIVKALNIQTNLSTNVLSTIHYHTQDKKTCGLANLLNTLANDLEQELPTIDALRSIITVTNSLQIFANPNPEERFIKSMLILMLNFHTKQHNNSHNNYLDSAKWLKSLLSVSEKSSLIRLIDYIAIRLSIAKISIHSDKTNIELTELFFVIEDLAKSIEIETQTNCNLTLIKNINAIILVSIACNKNPLVFVDVVANQIQDNNTNLVLLTKKFFAQASQVYKFIQNNSNNLYNKNTEEFCNINLQEFLMCFTNILHEELISKFNEYIPEIQSIKKLIIACNHNSEKMNDDEYRYFLKNQNITPEITESFTSTILSHILIKLKESTKHTNSISYIANKLINLGFTPRSYFFSRLGIFTPLITKNKFEKDYENIKNLSQYINNLNSSNKTLIIKELFISLLVRYRANPYKLENQPKPVQNKTSEKNYLAPLHHYTKHYNIVEKNTRANANYQITFFAKKAINNKKQISMPNLRSTDIENNIMSR